MTEDNAFHQILLKIVETCKRLRRAGRELLRYYFELGRLVDVAYGKGFSYRQLETHLRGVGEGVWIPRHATLFNAHKFYKLIMSQFGGDIDRFLMNNPDVTWRKIFHRKLPAPNTAQSQKTCHQYLIQINSVLP